MRAQDLGKGISIFFTCFEIFFLVQVRETVLPLQVDILQQSKQLSLKTLIYNVYGFLLIF